MKGKIFNAQEVQAMLNGSKVQFREVIKHKDSSREICPYQVGQKIFAKESFCPVNDEQFGEEFKHSWNATHKKPEEKFEANPWVWCVNFEVINN